METNRMFYCIPQKAYMRTDNCRVLRSRPIGKAPAGSQAQLKACENCTMYPMVDDDRVPTVTLEAFLSGAKPKALRQAAAAVRR
jgi:hypothetical protein